MERHKVFDQQYTRLFPDDTQVHTPEIKRFEDQEQNKYGVTVTFLIVSKSNAGLWDTFEVYRDEFTMLLRESVGEIWNDTFEVSISYSKGSIIVSLLLIATSQWFVAHQSFAASIAIFLGLYDPAKVITKDVFRGVHILYSRVNSFFERRKRIMALTRQK